MKTFEQFYHEDVGTVIMEPVHIRGIGDVEAKVDSGNADVNVIHGHSVKHDGDDVSFATVYDKTIKSKKVGEDEHGPQVILHVKIQDHRHVPVKFSVRNKKDDTEKVVLGVDHLKPIEVEQD